MCKSFIYKRRSRGPRTDPCGTPKLILSRSDEIPSIEMYLIGFEPHNSLKLSFTIIQGLCSNFVECESFLESNSPDILALCETNLNDSVDSGNFSVRGYLPFIWKDSTIHMHGLAVYVKGRLLFARDLYLENSADSYSCFWLGLLHSVSYFFFLCQPPSSSLCMVFYSISSNIDEVVSTNPSANMFVFGDFNVHDEDWLTYFGGTDRPGELWYNCSISNFTQMVNLILTVLLFWIYLFLLMLVCVLQWLSLYWEMLIMLLSQFPLTFS